MTPDKRRVQHSRGEDPVARIQKGPHQRQGQSSPPAGPAPGKCVGVPGEVGHGADRAERGQAPSTRQNVKA